MTDHPQPDAPAYPEQEERDAWSQGYQDARNGLPMDATTEYPNAYANGFWNGNAARVDAIREGRNREPTR